MLVGALELAGEGCSDGGDASEFHGLGSGFRRGPGGSPVHETTGKGSRVSAVSTGSTVEGSVGRGKHQHGEAVPSPTSGSGGARRSSTTAAALLRLLRPPGGAREVVECLVGSGVG